MLNKLSKAFIALVNPRIAIKTSGYCPKLVRIEDTVANYTFNSEGSEGLNWKTESPAGAADDQTCLTHLPTVP